MLIFQFSLWDSMRLVWAGRIAQALLAFNSLYEIPSYTSIAASVHISFQFSLWDSLRWLQEIVFKPLLSILFMRFTVIRQYQNAVLQYFFQFSLWDSEAIRIAIKDLLWAFNSLYEIHFITPTRILLCLNLYNFQFSLWDSNFRRMTVMCAVS